MEPEKAHNLALWALSSGLVYSPAPEDERLRVNAFGRELAHPLGLAAGFDKNAAAVEHVGGIGFSFAEIGTVTPLPQSGNPKPRMFRLKEEEAIINRLGFNNEGAAAVANRLEGSYRAVPIGVNIGKNRSTSIEDAVSDYLAAFDRLRGLGDYYVVNVSSPNTPGLRDLQNSSHLTRIVSTLMRSDRHCRLFIKVSPDQSDDEIREICRVCIGEGVIGIVATNTTLAREGLRSVNASEAGGLSGRPLCRRAEDVCRLIRDTAAGLFIIGVGGISTGKDLLQRLRAGADLCQIYTALVYRGPAAVSMILSEYLAELDAGA